MTFTPLLQRPWGKKARTVTWKLKTAIIWFVIVIAIWLGTFLFFMSLKPTGENAGQIIGSTLGYVAGAILFIGWLVILTRPGNRGTVGGSL
jgi:zinc transporter ZupT